MERVSREETRERGRLAIDTSRCQISKDDESFREIKVKFDSDLTYTIELCWVMKINKGFAAADKRGRVISQLGEGEQADEWEG